MCSGWFSFAALSCLRGAVASAPSDGRLIARVEARYNKARLCRSILRRAISLLGHRRPPESGTLTLRKQGKMRWDYTTPPGKLFISDGKICIPLYRRGQ